MRMSDFLEQYEDINGRTHTRRYLDKYVIWKKLDESTWFYFYGAIDFCRDMFDKQTVGQRGLRIFLRLMLIMMFPLVIIYYIWIFVVEFISVVIGMMYWIFALAANIIIWVLPWHTGFWKWLTK